MRGFTLIELIIVIGASAIFIATSVGVYISFLKRSYLDVAAREMQSVINLARSQTISSEESQRFGVHIDDINNEYIFFSGDSYIVGDPENEIFAVHERVSISSLNFQGGGSDIIFDRLTGETSAYGVVTLEDSVNSLFKREICINRSGIVEIQQQCAENLLFYDTGTTDLDLASFPSNAGQGDPGQSFTTGSGDVYAGSVDLYLRKTTPDPSDIFLEIREASTVGDVIGRSWILDGSSIGDSYGWIRFIFSDPVFLQSSTQYFLRLRSLPDSAIALSGAAGTIYWGYEHSASSPPGYAGGDAWRYINENNTPIYEGEKLGPVDQYDFSFKIVYGIDPPSAKDSRHMEFDLKDASGFSWGIEGAASSTLVFSDIPDVAMNISIPDFSNASSTVFDWEDDVDVNGNIEKIRIHTNYMDSNNTILSVHRDGRFNDKAVTIYIDSKEIVSYTAIGDPTVGVHGGSMIYR